jgi:pyruvate formate lyase activating enzyme
MQSDLADVLSRIKALGYLVKLDTNGTRPSLLQEIIDRGLVDFVAMDIKAPKGAYDAMSGASADLAAIERSIRVIGQLAEQYEFRTTVAPGLSADDLLEIGRWLKGSHAYWLQEFQAPACKRLVDDRCREQPALKAADLKAVWNQLRTWFEIGGVRS